MMVVGVGVRWWLCVLVLRGDCLDYGLTVRLGVVAFIIYYLLFI